MNSQASQRSPAIPQVSIHRVVYNSGFTERYKKGHTRDAGSDTGSKAKQLIRRPASCAPCKDCVNSLTFECSAPSICGAEVVVVSRLCCGSISSFSDANRTTGEAWTVFLSGLISLSELRFLGPGTVISELVRCEDHWRTKVNHKRMVL